MPKLYFAQSPTEPECDFLAQLSQRLEVGPDTAFEQLATWLVTYEPERRHPIRTARASAASTLIREDSGEECQVA